MTANVYKFTKNRIEDFITSFPENSKPVFYYDREVPRLCVKISRNKRDEKRGVSTNFYIYMRRKGDPSSRRWSIASWNDISDLKYIR